MKEWDDDQICRVCNPLRSELPLSMTAFSVSCRVVLRISVLQIDLPKLETLGFGNSTFIVSASAVFKSGFADAHSL